LAGVLVIAAACSGAAATTAPTTAPATSAPATAAPPTKNTSGPFSIGYSNGGGVGNGFREEQVCTAKAEATALGPSKITSPLTVIHRNTDAAGQLSDLRTLISQHVNAIVFNPNGPDALNPALAEAHAAGIVTVSVDAYVTDPNTWNLYNNQVKYAYLGASWLFKQLGGKGTVWYTRGLAGHPADSDRDVGFNQALKENPGITVANPGGTFTGWDPATATQITNDFLASGGYDKVDGIWASGMGSQIDDAILAANPGISKDELLKNNPLLKSMLGGKRGTASEIAPLFSDLPQPRPGQELAPAAPVSSPSSAGTGWSPAADR